MRYIDILSSFEREINKLDSSLDKPVTDDSLYWLNQAVYKFIKLRFNGDFVHKTSYEQNEKRYKDLIHLYSELQPQLSQIVSHDTYNEYDIEYPKDFMFTLSEDVIIDSTSGGHKLDTCVFECTADSFMYRITNSLTDFHYRYHRARPLRVRTESGCKLLTDKNYVISKYTLSYLRNPIEITLQNPFNEYTDFEDIIMPEIIKIAAQMYLENQSEKRYDTISAEVNTQE